MPYQKKLVGQLSYLSPCQPEDAESWLAWFNDPEVCIPLGDEAYVNSTAESIQLQLQHSMREDSHVYSIVRLSDDRLIGRGMLFSINSVDATAMLGLAIGEKACWGQGYGTDAMLLLLDLAFNLLNLNSVMLGVYAFNQPAIHLYQKVGFKPIGVRRQARIIAGRKYDAILMDILAEEYHAAHGSGRSAEIITALAGNQS